MIKKRILNTDDLADIQDGMTTLGDESADLLLRVNNMETHEGDIVGRVIQLENRIVPKSANIAKVTANATSGIGIQVVGITVASTAALQEVKDLALQNKDRTNKIIDAFIGQGLMLPA